MTDDTTKTELLAELESVIKKDPAQLPQLRRLGIVADEPAMDRALEAGAEWWGPQLLAHFRLALVAHLQRKGAHTAQELIARPPEVLGLAMNEREVTVALESARRHELVGRLDPGSGAGPVAASDEWVATEAGRQGARHGAPWVLGHIGHIGGGALATLGAILAIFGSKLSVEGGAGAVVGIAALVLAVMGVVAGLAVWIRARRSGTAASTVAAGWIRWSVAFPDLDRRASKRFPWVWLLISVVAIVVGVTAPSWMPGAPWVSSLVLTVGALGGWILFLSRVVSWFTRWTDIRIELYKRSLKALAEAPADPPQP